MQNYCAQLGDGPTNSLWCLIYDFQTLLTGLAAIAIALLTLIPIWKQLRDSNLQARISHRETLASILRAGLRRFEKVEEAMREPLSAAWRETHDPVGDPTKIGAEAAHYLEQVFNRVLDWYLVVLAGTEHVLIEAEKAKLKTALSELVETLGDAHWADHNDQQQDEVFIPDEEWTEIKTRCAAAKIDAAAKVSAVRSAFHDLRTAQDNWTRSLREGIARLDRQITE